MDRILSQAAALVQGKITPKEFRASLVAVGSTMSDEDALKLALMLKPK